MAITGSVTSADLDRDLKRGDSSRSQDNFHATSTMVLHRHRPIRLESRFELIFAKVTRPIRAAWTFTRRPVNENLAFFAISAMFLFVAVVNHFGGFDTTRADEERRDRENMVANTVESSLAEERSKVRLFAKHFRLGDTVRESETVTDGSLPYLRGRVLFLIQLDNGALCAVYHNRCYARFRQGGYQLRDWETADYLDKTAMELNEIREHSICSVIIRTIEGMTKDPSAPLLTLASSPDEAETLVSVQVHTIDSVGYGGSYDKEATSFVDIWRVQMNILDLKYKLNLQETCFVYPDRTTLAPSYRPSSLPATFPEVCDRVRRYVSLVCDLQRK